MDKPLMSISPTGCPLYEPVFRVYLSVLFISGLWFEIAGPIFRVLNLS